MVMCLIALYPLSRLDPIVLIRLLAGTTVYILARDQRLYPGWLNTAFQDNLFYWSPAIRLAAIIALVWICLPGQFRARIRP